MTTTTKTILGHEISLTPGHIYRAECPMPVAIHRLKYHVRIDDITFGVRVSDAPIHRISGLEYDDAVAFVAAFNDTKDAYRPAHRVW